MTKRVLGGLSGLLVQVAGVSQNELSGFARPSQRPHPARPGSFVMATEDLRGEIGSWVRTCNEVDHRGAWRPHGGLLARCAIQNLEKRITSPLAALTALPMNLEGSLTTSRGCDTHAVRLTSPVRDDA